MNPVIQATTMAHARVVGPMNEMVKAISVLHANGWAVTRSGPLPTHGLTVDPTQYELRAEKLIGGANAWGQSLSLAFKGTS